MRSEFGFQPVHAFADEIKRGRFLPNDAERIEAFFGSYQQAEVICRTREREAAAILRLYLRDLMAVAVLRQQEREERQRAYEALTAVLRCNPNDGDMWVRLALVSQMLERDTNEIMQAYALSQTTEPNEPATQQLRDLYFPRPDLGDD
jgi:tetratricopeptide (TPR) repeat protein